MPSFGILHIASPTPPVRLPWLGQVRTGAMIRWMVLRVGIWAAWGVVFLALWHFLRVWFMPDGCLDQGGSFNYELWECSGELNEYIDVPAYRLPAFWYLLGSLALAVRLNVYCRGTASRGGLTQRQDSRP